jgi:hypothetical protein
MFGGLFFFVAASTADMKIRNMPIFDKLAECRGGLESFELAKPLDGQGLR